MTTVEPIRSKRDIRQIENILARQCKRDLLLFILGTNSGLRISDLLALNVGDVKDKSYIEITEKKTGKPKKFPINRRLRYIIADYCSGMGKNEPLFQSMWHKRLDRTTSYYIIHDACKKAGVPGAFGTHTMRKTFGYHHYQQFRDVVILQKIFNHSNPKITMRYIGIEQDNIDRTYMQFML